MFHLWWYWKLRDNRHWIKRSGSSSGSTIIWFATLLHPNRIFRAYSIVAPPIRSVFVSTICKIHLWWYWRLQGKRQKMKSSGCSSGSTIIWFATLLLPLRFFSAYSIGAPPFPSIFVSNIATFHLWWYWKLRDNRHWIKRSGCSSGSTVIWFATLLLPFRIFSAYSIVAPPIPSVLVSTIAKIHLWWNWKLHDNRHWIKGMVARVEALLCDLPPFYCQIEFSVHIALSLLQFHPYSFPPLLRFIYDGIGSFTTTVIG